MQIDLSAGGPWNRFPMCNPWLRIEGSRLFLLAQPTCSAMLCTLWSKVLCMLELKFNVPLLSKFSCLAMLLALPLFLERTLLCVLHCICPKNPRGTCSVAFPLMVERGRVATIIMLFLPGHLHSSLKQTLGMLHPSFSLPGGARPLCLKQKPQICKDSTRSEVPGCRKA